MIRNEKGQFAGNQYKKIDGEWYRKQCLDCGKWLKGIYAQRCRSCAMKFLHNKAYKGSEAGYMSKHDWIKRYFGKPSYCEHCYAEKARFEWANLSGQYYRNRDDWRRLCANCHRIFDAIGYKS